ncbi:MAG: hypothetical protein AAF236_00955 [Verrucomicrobiota bacterium]
MSVAIKVRDEIAEQAREAAKVADRSLTGQLEHWAKLGAAIEPFLSLESVSSLKAGSVQEEHDTLEKQEQIAALDSALAAFLASSKRQLRVDLGLDQQVRYEPIVNEPGRFKRIDPSGTISVGRLVDRDFVEDTSQD